MEARAIAKYVKGSPQKARLVVDLIRGKRIDQALSILSLNAKALSRDIEKVVKSAKKTRKVAGRTLDSVKEKIGLRYL